MGGIGVSIFFVLSGFLITYLILNESKSNNGRFAVKSFYIRRILRICPLYFAVIAFAFLIYPYLKSMMGTPDNILNKPGYYLLFLSNFDVIHIEKNFPGLNFSLLSNTWSVAIEEQFYIIWPLLLYFIPKNLYPFTFTATLILSLIFRYLHVQDETILYYHSLSVCGDLALGGLCAYYSIYSSGFKLFFEKLSQPSILGTYVVGMLWLIYSNGTNNSSYVPVFTRFLSTLFFAFIVLEQNYSKASFYKFSKSNLLNFWGKYTYGLYLLHPIALLVSDILLRTTRITNLDNPIVSVFRGFLSLGISLLLSYVSYEFYESYFLRLKKKYE